MSISVDGTNGVTYPDLSVQNTAATGFGFKNRIINGACVIDQRNAGASVTLNNTASYTLDRWYDRCVGGAGSAVITVQRSTVAPAGFTNSSLITVTTSKTPAASEQFWRYQAIEGFNAADLAFGSASASTVTLSFWVRASVTGAYSVALQNSAQNRSYVATYTVNAANTWEQKTVTVAGDTSGTWLTDNSVGLYVFFDTGSGSNFNTTAGAWGAGTFYRTSGSVSLISNAGATFYITGVQLEKGSTATSFDYRPYGTELALCQRYYQIVRNGIMLGNSASVVVVNSMLSPTMRATPSLSQQGVIENTNGSTDRTQSSVSITLANGADNSVLYTLGNFSGLTANVPYAFRLSANTNGVTASAEL